MTHISRREFLSSLLFASVQSIVPASMQGTRGRESFVPGAKALSLKLIPHEGMLVGRILATDSKTVMLPFVLSLDRMSA